VATRLETVQYIADQAGLGTRLEFRKMFGEYALYVDGKVTALVCDDQMFLKPTAEARAYLGPVAEGAPYPGAKPHLLLGEVLEDSERLARVLQITAAALPVPKPKGTPKARPKRKRL